jgi:hypothetical protein
LSQIESNLTYMFLMVRCKVCDIGATQIFTRLQGVDNMLLALVD